MKIPAIALLLIAALAGTAHAQSRSFTAFGGSAYNVPTTLTIRQADLPVIRLTARYDTKPFGPNAPYYSWRLSFWNAARTRAWEVRQVHHRLFLSNMPPEIQVFAIHYGYTFLMAGLAWRHGGVIVHVDAGVIVCAPQNTVRGKKLPARGAGVFDTAYYVSGGGAELAISREFRISRRWFAAVNAGLLGGFARVPVVDGKADVPNIGLHGQLGLGVRF